MDPSIPIEDGHYARKQIRCQSSLIAWSHRSRFQLALDLARQFAGKTLLDYGCGDGTFLALLMESGPKPAQAVGAEVGQDQIEDCRKRLARYPGLNFLHVGELDTPDQSQRFDGIFCTEVLEHVVDRETALNRCHRILKPGGRLIISVPIETGLPLLIKQTARRIAGWRKLGDYAHTSRYTWPELRAALFAGDQQHMPRPMYGQDTPNPYHEHKGFNWRVLRREIAQRFRIERTLTSPLSWPGTQFSSQIWFVASK